MKRVLITGASSYIGESVKAYLLREPECFSVDVMDTIGLRPEPGMFNGYDTVFNIAGIAHVRETDANRHLYYEINRDLVVEIARAAKESNVRQFVLLSTMSVYGKTEGHITPNTPEQPVNA